MWRRFIPAKLASKKLLLPIIIIAIILASVGTYYVFSAKTTTIRTSTTNITTSTSSTSQTTPSSTSTVRTTTSTSTISYPLALLVPLYTDPGNDPSWNQIMLLAQLYPNVRIDAIINPDNGPGTSIDPNYVNGTGELQKAGITVIGYVYTSYGARQASSILSDIKDYKTWYNVSGIFLDEMSDSPSTAEYYSNLTSTTHSLGVHLVIGNPGTNVSKSLIESVDNIVVYETSGLPSASTICGSTFGLPRSTISMIVDNENAMPSPSYLRSISDCAGFVYFTNQPENSNTYNVLPSYIGLEVSEVALLNKMSS